MRALRNVPVDHLSKAVSLQREFQVLHKMKKAGHLTGSLLPS